MLRCLQRDYRWDLQVDERARYLAGLVRDLGLPVGLLTGLLAEDPSDNVLDVLEVLGRSGDAEAVDGLRRYVREGPRWVDVLQAIAGSWPRALWDDLLPAVSARLRQAGGECDVWWGGEPWQHWAAVDDRIAAEVAAVPPRRTLRPYAREPAAVLLARLRTGDADRRKAALRELNRRGPEPVLLAMMEDLPLEHLFGPVRRALELLGPRALPLARSWAGTPGHPLRWPAHMVLAAHGGASDVPALLAGWDWLDSRENDLCGYQDLAAGLARIGGPAAEAAVGRLRRAWFSPHSYERAGYLRALMALDRGAADRLLTEGLWDCESEVRLIAAGHAAATPAAGRRLHALRDDPVETPEVRAAAAARLG